MNLDNLKQLSEIFNNFTQPIATFYSFFFGCKLVSQHLNKKEIKIFILFTGIILTLFKSTWLIGAILMLVGFYLINRTN